MKRKHKEIIGKLMWVLFIIYIFALTYFLFFSERYGRTAGSGEYHYNLTPFKEITRFIRYRDKIGWESFVVNIFGNILAFMPFGFALPVISPHNRRFLNTVLLSLELTLTIELMQLLLKVGCFDVDDIILNTLGGIFGYICFAIVKKVIWRMGKGKEKHEKGKAGGL